jgi:hypothetical protein
MPRESSHVGRLGLGVATLGMEDEAQARNGCRNPCAFFCAPFA